MDDDSTKWLKVISGLLFLIAAELAVVVGLQFQWFM